MVVSHQRFESHNTHLNKRIHIETQLGESGISIWSLNQSEIEYLFVLRSASDDEFSIDWTSNFPWITNGLRRVQPLGSSHSPGPWETRQCVRLSGLSRVRWGRCSRREAAGTVLWWGCSIRRPRRTSLHGRFGNRGLSANMSLRWDLSKNPPTMSWTINLRSSMLWPRTTTIKFPLFLPSWLSFSFYFSLSLW